LTAAILRKLIAALWQKALFTRKRNDHLLYQEKLQLIDCATVPKLQKRFGNGPRSRHAMFDPPSFAVLLALNGQSRLPASA
jgi:hypothetical protein